MNLFFENLLIKFKMSHFKKFIYIFISLTTITGCTSYKNMLYIRDAETITAEEFAANIVVPVEARIMQKDVLNISVYTSDPEAALPYNLSVTGSTASNYSPSSQQALQKYLVDINGFINFPTLGLIKVSGMTLSELENYIKDRISKYVKEQPIVSVQFIENTFTVIGEVGGPGTFTIQNEKLNILKALSMAGGITNFSKLDNVKIFREDCNGKKQIVIVNLNDKNLLFSPEFYVQRNDMIYIEATKSKQMQFLNQQVSLYSYGITFILSMTTLILNFANLK